MRKILIVLFLVFASLVSVQPAAAQDAGWQFVYATSTQRYGDFGFKTELSLFALYAFDPLLGASCFTQAAPMDGFGQLTCGPTIALGGFQIGQNVGLTTLSDDIPMRGATWLYGAGKMWDMFGTLEYGSGGTWHQVIVRTNRIDTEFAPAPHIGLISTRYVGEGVYADYQWKNVRLSGSVVLGIEDHLRDKTGAGAGDFVRSELSLRLTL